MEKITLKDISTLVSGLQYAQGFQHVKRGDLQTLWVGDRTIGGQIRNSVRPHTVRIRFSDDGKPVPSCTCKVRSRQPFCAHVTAVLIAWATQRDGFRQYRGPDTAPLVEGPVQRARQDPLVAFRVTLDRVEALLRDLLAHGLVTINARRTRVIQETWQLANSYGLGRIAQALAEVNTEVGRLSQPRTRKTSGQTFDEARYSKALVTAWHLTQEARLALDAGDLTRLREIASMALADEPVAVLESVRLVQVGFHGQGNRPNVGTSYLLELDSGRLLAERLPMSKPSPRTNSMRRGSVIRGRVAVYPASDIDEAVVLDVEETEPPDPQVWQQAQSWAKIACDVLVGRIRDVAARMPGADEAHVWFAPAHVLVRSDEIRLLDAAGMSLPVEPSTAIGRLLLDAPVLSTFGAVGRTDSGLRFTAMSLLMGGEAPQLVLI